MKKILLSLLGLVLLCGPASAAETKLRNGLYANEFVGAAALRALQLEGRPLVILDARTQRSYAEGRIAGAILPRNRAYYLKEERFRKGEVQTLEREENALADGMKDVSRNTPLVTYCSRGCGASAVLFYELKDLGFTDVRVLDEGIEDWIEAGYPVETG